MMTGTGLPGKSLVHPKLTLHPAGVQTVGQESPPPTGPLEEEVLETATLTGTGSSLEVLLTGMVRTELAALQTEGHPRQMRRIDGAESPLSPHPSASLVVLTVAALLELHAARAAIDGQGDLSRLQQQTAQLQQLLQSAVV